MRLLTLKVGVYNGQGESLNDVNNKKSFGARGTFGVTDKLDVGASWFAHDGIITVNGVPDSTFTNYAWGVDGSVGQARGRGPVRAGRVPRWERSVAGQAPDAGHAVRGGLQHPDEQSHELALRGRALVPSRLRRPQHRRGRRWPGSITAGVGVYLSSKTWFRVAYEQEEFQGDAPSISGIRSMLGVSF